MRLPTHARLSFTCSGAGLCSSTPRASSLSSSSSTPLSLIPASSSLSRRSTAAGQSRVLLTAAALSPQQRHQGEAASCARLRSPLQWSRIAHSARDPTYSCSKATVTMGGSQQVRAHSHGHGGHHHHHDTTFLTSGNRSDPGVRITRVGLYVNLGMAVAKGAGGYIFNSQA